MGVDLCHGVFDVVIKLSYLLLLGKSCGNKVIFRWKCFGRCPYRSKVFYRIFCDFSGSSILLDQCVFLLFFLPFRLVLFHIQDPGEKGFHSFRCFSQGCKEIPGLCLQGFIPLFPDAGILPGGFQFLLQVCNHSGSGDGFLRQIL